MRVSALLKLMRPTRTLCGPQEIRAGAVVWCTRAREFVTKMRRYEDIFVDVTMIESALRGAVWGTGSW